MRFQGVQLLQACARPRTWPARCAILPAVSNPDAPPLARCRRHGFHRGIWPGHHAGRPARRGRAGRRHRQRHGRRCAAGRGRDHAHLPVADGVLRPAGHQPRRAAAGGAGAAGQRRRRAGSPGAALAPAHLLRGRLRARPGRHRRGRRPAGRRRGGAAQCHAAAGLHAGLPARLPVHGRSAGCTAAAAPHQAAGAGAGRQRVGGQPAVRHLPLGEPGRLAPAGPLPGAAVRCPAAGARPAGARRPVPALLAPGDRVQFQPVPWAEFQRLQTAAQGGDIDPATWREAGR